MDKANTFVYELSKLDAYRQEQFFEKIKDIVTPEEYTALAYGVSFFGLLTNPEKTAALKKSIADQLYSHFNKSE